jgi:hypothetical protein
MIDVRSAAVAVRLPEEMLNNLPVARSLPALINLAPGVASDVAFGGSQRGNEILIDGVRMTDPMFQDPLTRVNYNWIQEINIVGLGAGAEHGGFTGVSANAILRSGSNQFRGQAEHWTTEPRWLDNNTGTLSAQLQRRFTSRTLFDWRESSAQVGGPIVRDRLWFFTGLSRADHEDRPAGYSGPGSRDERELQFIAKPALALGRSHRVDGFIERGKRRVDGQFLGVEVPIEATNDVHQPQTVWNVTAHAVVNPTTLLELKHSGYAAEMHFEPHAPATREGPYPHIDFGTARYSHNTSLFVATDSAINTTSGAITRHLHLGRAGTHAMKLGGEYEHTRVREEYGWPGGRVYYDFFGVTEEVEFWNGAVDFATTRRHVLFAQDEWTIGDRFTVTPGVRVEFNRGSVPGKPNTFATNPVAPRFGVAWDLRRDHRTVLRFHYGHYFDPISASRIAQNDSSVENARTAAYVTGPDQYEIYSVSTSEHRFAIDPDLRHSHVKQLIVGAEHQFLRNVSLQAQFIHRRFADFMGLIDTGSAYVPVERPDPGPDGVLNTADDGAAMTAFLLTNPGKGFDVYTNPPQAYNEYNAVQLVGRKRFSDDWQLQSSYTWSRARGTVGNRWHVNAARFNLGNPGNFVNPNSFINADGRLPFDPTHEVKLLGTYRAPWAGGVLVSGVARYSTGQAWSRTAFLRNLPDLQRVRVEPLGTRRAPALNTLALRIEKTVTLPRALGTLGLFADVFNVTNQGVPDSDVTNPINDQSGARFGEPNAWLSPRMLRVGVRASF